MHKIRKSVFETNSSSSHSLTLGKGDLVAQPFPADVLRQGFIVLAAGDYNWEWHRYYTAEGKLAYLLTQVTNGQVPRDIDALCEDNERVAMMRRVVKEHTGCDLALSRSSGGIDHQSAMGEGGTGLELFNSDETLKAFLFDSESCIETGNDNDSAPWEIDTDRGRELFYVKHIREVPKSYRTVTVQRVEQYRELGYVTGGGAVVCEVLNPDLLARLMKFGIVQKAVWTGNAKYNPFEYSDIVGRSAADIVSDGPKASFTLSPKFSAESKVKVSRDTSMDAQPVMALTVMVPADLATALKALPKTPKTLAKLAKVRCRLLCNQRSLKDNPDNKYLITAVESDTAKVTELELRAKVEGLV